MNASTALVLASASPRRKVLLSHICTRFIQDQADIDESPLVDEHPSEQVCRLASQKVDALLQNYPNHWVLGSDTIIALNDRALGKPKSLTHSLEILSSLSGKWHEVMTAVSLKGVVDGQVIHKSCCIKSKVEMCEITEKQIVEYWQTKEPQDKAGSYAIQGIGGQFVKQIKGSYSAIVGLPLVETKQLLVDVGVLS